MPSPKSPSRKRATKQTKRAPRKKKVILLRTSERTAFKRCRFAWDITYNKGLKPHVDAPALRFGTLVHKALELRYPPGTKRGPHPAKTFERLYEKELEEAMGFGFRDQDGMWHDACAMGVDMLEHFVEVYGNDDEWKVIQSEMTFQVPVLETATHILMYVGIIDGVWQNRLTKELWLRDWKTAKSIPANMGTHLTLDEQPGSYWAYAPEFLLAKGVLKPKQRLQGIDFLYMRKAIRDPRPTDSLGRCLNKDGTVSQKQPATYFKRVPTYRTQAEMRSLRERVLQEAKEHELVRRGKLAAYKNPSQMNCGMCAVRDVCELHEAEQDWEALLNATFQTWDGYSDHAIAVAELK